MAKIESLVDIGSLGNPIAARAAINANNQRIEDALQNTISRDGSLPNQMEADIDLNGNYLLNVADAVSDGDGVNLRQLQLLISDAFANIDPGLRVDLANVLLGAALVGYDPISGAATTVKGYLDSLDAAEVISIRTDLASTSSGEGLSLLGVPSDLDLTFGYHPTLHFSSNGANVQRLGDRVFVGGAVVNDGAFPNVVRDWLADYWIAGGFSSGPSVSATVATMSSQAPNSAIPFLSAAQSKYFTSAATTAIGGFSVAFNDNTTLATKVYGHYVEAHRTTATAADTYGLEIDTRTLTASVSPSPFQLGDVVGLQLASGAEWSAGGQFDASAALQIAPNPMKFKVGINVMNTALVDLGGGLKEVMAFPSGGMLRSWTGAAAPGSFIYFATTVAAGSASLQLANGSAQFMDTSTGAPAARFNVVASAVNYPNTLSGVTGAPAVYAAEGTDANIDVEIRPKGTGVLKIGKALAVATVPANFSATRTLAFKDSTGTVFYIPAATAVW